MTDFKYTVYYDHIEITKYTGSDTDVTVPSMINGLPVTSIGNSAFGGCSSLMSVTIPESVMSIGNSAFGGCSSLTSVTIPESVTSIGHRAFWNCPALMSVTIPDSVMSIGISPFGRCEKLTEILVTAGNPYFKSVDGVLFTADGKTLIQAPAAKGLTEYTIPDGVTSIGDHAFEYCKSLTSVTISESVTYIGNYAFCLCFGLKSVTIPQSVRDIGDNAFGNCSKLAIYGAEGSAAQMYALRQGIQFFTASPYCDAAGVYYSHDNKTLLRTPSSLSGKYTIPESVINMDACAFAECRNLTEIQVPAGNTHFKSVDGILFAADEKTLLHFPAAKDLTEYTIPESVTSIGDHAFRNCAALTSVTIPESVTSIGVSAFTNCEKLTEILVSAGNPHFKSVDGILFSADGKTLIQVPAGKCLTEYTIHDGVTSIGDHAFECCKSLESVTIPYGVTSIQESAFSNCEKLQSINVTASNTHFKSVNGLLFSRNGQTLLLFPCGKGMTDYVVPERVTKIGENAFRGCKGLTSVTISESVKVIADNAFEDCSSSLTIHGKYWSCAQRHAQQKHIRFKGKYSAATCRNFICATLAIVLLVVWRMIPNYSENGILGTFPSGTAAGERMVKTVDGIEYAFRWCPAGTFTMGSSKSEWDAANFTWESYNETQHSVTLTRGFWMLETEVTQAMWESVMGTSIRQQRDKANRSWPLRGEGSDYPMYYVSWEECRSFCEELSEKLGLPVSLPTEAQWEYACRAGTTGAYAGDLGEMGWYWDNSGDETHPVGQKKPNAWGLYDMHGNVWEWCQDWYDRDYYTESPTSDPCNLDSSGSCRVDRGGNWGNDAQFCRSAYRSRSAPDDRRYNLGFRPVLASPVPEE